MTLRQRFLFLFADHRDALERAQRAEDEAQRLQFLNDAVQKRYDELVTRTLNEAAQDKERLMRVRYGDRIVLTPEQIAAGLKQVEPRKERELQPNARAWQRKQTLEVEDELRKYAKEITQ